MSYRYKSPLLAYLLIKVIHLFAILLFVPFFTNAFTNGNYVSGVLLTLPSLLFFVLFLRTKRILIDASGVAAGFWPFKRFYPYSRVKKASQIKLLAPKTLYISLKTHNPLGFIWCPVAMLVGMDEWFGMDEHDAVEYINTRAQATGA